MCTCGAHAVRMDGKVHYGTRLTIERGATMKVPKKLALVTTSSTEIEVVADGEHFTKCVWFRYFRLA